MEISDWQDILALNPKGYVEIQNHEENVIYHGPLASLEYDNSNHWVWVNLKWVAQMGLPGTKSFGNWEKGPDEMLRFPIINFLVPFVIERTPEKGNRIRFSEYNIMYINEVDGIDPKKVKGLNFEQPATS